MVPDRGVLQHPGGYGRRRSEHTGSSRAGLRLQGDQQKNLDWGQTPGLYTNFMSRYFTKVGEDFTNQVGVPVQIVMEPDFLGYGHQFTQLQQSDSPTERLSPRGFRAILRRLGHGHDAISGTARRTPVDTTTPKPVSKDRTQNYANVMKPMVDAGLLSASGPRFDNTIEGMVGDQLLRRHHAESADRLEDQISGPSPQRFPERQDGCSARNGLRHLPWQNKWSSGVGWEAGRARSPLPERIWATSSPRSASPRGQAAPTQTFRHRQVRSGRGLPLDPNWQTSGTERSAT